MTDKEQLRLWVKDRPPRPWPYWYEVRAEYRDLIRVRPKRWWRDLFIMPLGVWRVRRAERELFKVIPRDVLLEALEQSERASDG